VQRDIELAMMVSAKLLDAHSVFTMYAYTDKLNCDVLRMLAYLYIAAIMVLRLLLCCGE
jgi:hypothetical protein